jgi:aerobic-type carbon monoxide dehydrogenase small subunit (CoxS/CutS family)
VIGCKINGVARQLDVHPLKRALDVLREDCGLTGTKEGCGEGECGACTVLIDGIPINSCLVPAAHLDGTNVTTIEGVASRGKLHPLQDAFVVEGGAQCGICTPGMIMASLSIRRGASTAQIQETLAGNLCRCTGYEAIYRSVRKGAGRASGAGWASGASGAWGGGWASGASRASRAGLPRRSARRKQARAKAGR